MGGDTEAAGLERFLLAEYDHIADAHFNTAVSISRFFQYYLIIAAVPISAAGLILGFLQSGTTTGKDVELSHSLAIPPSYRLTIALVFTVVAIVGLLVMGYISNLRLDSILYARTVNGVRNYFYGKYPMPQDQEKIVRVLPTEISLPAYWQPWSFMFVVVAFGVIDCGYVLVGWLLRIGLKCTPALYLLIVGVVIFFALHVLIYFRLCRYRTNSYLKPKW